MPRNTSIRIIVIIAAIVVAATGAILRLLLQPNQYDNPAILVTIESNGAVVLDTHAGPVTAPLSGVSWSSSEAFMRGVDREVGIAKQDMVMYRLRDGSLDVWYDSADGFVHLNQRISQLDR